MKIVSITAEREMRQQALERAQSDAWAEYVRLQSIAKDTLRWEDARAAGMAWADFIALFVRGA